MKLRWVILTWGVVWLWGQWAKYPRWLSHVVTFVAGCQGAGSRAYGPEQLPVVSPCIVAAGLQQEMSQEQSFPRDPGRNYEASHAPTSEVPKPPLYHIYCSSKSLSPAQIPGVGIRAPAAWHEA